MKFKITTLCYLEKDGCYLMLYRNKKENDENEGKWIGVGGKMEAGESPDDCVRREVFEETGLQIKSCHFLGVISFINDVWGDEYMMLYHADSFSGNVTENCSEGTLRWIPKEEVLSLPLWEGDRPFLKKMIGGDQQINMKLVYREDQLVQIVDYGVDKAEDK